MLNIIPKTISEARKMFESGEIKPSELVQHYFDVIKEKDGEINAVLEVFSEAFELAKLSDKKYEITPDPSLSRGELAQQLLQLEGIPFLIKDNILYKGHISSAASLMLETYVSPYSATVINLLLEQGAIVLGRANMDDAALGGSGVSSAFGATKNPIDLERVPGGSSSGPAAALTAGMCLFALGSDTGGSIRQPASMCGVVGYKPTYGKNSRSGLIAAASSLDTIGIFANDVESVEIVEGVIGKFDVLDNTSLLDDFRNNRIETKTKYKIGYPENYLNAEGLNQEVKKNFFETIDLLVSQGHEVLPVNIDSLKYSLSAYYIINTAEVSSNLSRLDGLRFGGGDVGAVSNYGELFAKNRGKFFGPEIKRRIMIGTYVLSHGYYDAFYGKALQLRAKMRSEFERIFKGEENKSNGVDFIVMPTAPTTAWKFGEIKDPLSLYLEDIFTVPANLVGLPAISIPSGFDNKKLPIGFQILGAYMEDEKLLTFAKSINK